MAPSKRASLFLGAAVTLLSAAPVWAQQGDAAESPQVRQKKSGGAFLVEGIFGVDAPKEVVWNVLTDYERIASFVSSIRRSVVLERRPEHILLEQHATVRALFITKEVRVVLDVYEVPGRSIVFRDVSRSDFDAYEGSWNIAEASTGSRVTYRLRAQPQTQVPSLITADVFKSTAADLLKQVRAEMLRRHRSTGQPLVLGSSHQVLTTH